MKKELKRIDPLRTANVGALVYGLMMTVFMVLFSPLFLIAALLAPTEEGFGPVLMLVMLVVYPIMGFVMGWISGLLGAAIYNLVIRLTGGLIFEFEDVQPRAPAGPGI